MLLPWHANLITDFFDQISNNGWTKLVFIEQALVICGALFFALLLYRWLLPRISQEYALGRWLAHGGLRLAFPLSALMLTWFGKLLLQLWFVGMPFPLIRMANVLLLAMVIVACEPIRPTRSALFVASLA